MFKSTEEIHKEAEEFEDKLDEISKRAERALPLIQNVIYRGAVIDYLGQTLHVKEAPHLEDGTAVHPLLGIHHYTKLAGIDTYYHCPVKGSYQILHLSPTEQAVIAGVMDPETLKWTNVVTGEEAQ